MTSRVPVLKTYKLFIGGKFPRSESGRTMVVADPAGGVVAHACRASRKDLRDAVEAAEAAQPGWAGASAYLRGQIVYRLAEMAEGKRAELAAAISATGEVSPGAALAEVDASVDRLVAFAGWADKFQQVIGCHNPVTGPYYNFSVPEPMGVVGVIAPDSPSLLGLVSLLVPAVVAGNAVVALASGTSPIAACVLAEALATSDLPPGVVNILTGDAGELAAEFAGHREICALAAVGPRHARTLELGAAENLKRVTIWPAERDFCDPAACEGPGAIEPFLEIKTIWHPSSA